LNHWLCWISTWERQFSKHLLFPLKRGTFCSSGFSCFGSTVTNCCFGKLIYLIIYFESSEIFYCKFFIFLFKFFNQRCKLWVLNCCLSFEHFESCHQGKYSRKPSCRRLRVNLLAAKLITTWMTKKRNFEQEILKGEVSPYYWPPVWLVWNQLFENWNFLFLFAKQTNSNQSNRRSMVQWYFLFSIPCFESLTSFVAWSLIKCFLFWIWKTFEKPKLTRLWSFIFTKKWQK